MYNVPLDRRRTAVRVRGRNGHDEAPVGCEVLLAYGLEGLQVPPCVCVFVGGWFWREMTFCYSFDENCWTTCTARR